MPSKHIRSEVVSVTGGGSTTTVDPFTDSFSLAVATTEANAVPTDVDSYAISLSQTDTNDVQSETVGLNILGSGVNDSNAAPTDTNSFTLRVWLSATTMNSTNGVTNPTNADGQNNATVATYQSAAAGDANPRTTSALGANVPTCTVTSALFRGWFKSVNSLVTSTCALKLHSTTAAFVDKTMFSNAALNTTVDRLDGSFTYDLIANGIDTLAKIQSVQFLASTTDAAAGVSPHVLTIDAGAIDIAGAFT